MRARLLPLAALVLLIGGCDSSDDDSLTLNAEFYVGTWSLVSLSDGGGDRTAEVLALLDDFDATFRDDGTFQLTVDFSSVVNAAGQPDPDPITGTFQATTRPAALILVVSGLAPSLLAEAETRNRVDLTAPGIIIEQLLGAGLEIDFDGDVTLGIQRQ